MDISKALDWIKLSPKYLVPLAISCGAVLFSPDRFLNNLGLTALRDGYKPWIGGAFLITLALLVSHLAIVLSKTIRFHRFIHRQKKRLQNLTPAEQNILRPYIAQQTRTQYLHLQDGITRGLEQEKIIYCSSGLGDVFKGFAYNIQPWAWEYLNKHKELLA